MGRSLLWTFLLVVPGVLMAQGREKVKQAWTGPATLVSWEPTIKSPPMQWGPKGGRVTLPLPPESLHPDPADPKAEFRPRELVFDGQRLGRRYYRVPEEGQAPTAYHHAFLWFDALPGKWDREDIHRLSLAHFGVPHPLSEGRMLVVRSPKADPKRPGTSLPPFEVFRRDAKGVYQFESAPDHGFEDRLLLPSGRPKHPVLGDLAILGRMIALPKGAVYMLPSGLLWCFRPKGSLRGLVRLYAHHDDAYLEQHQPFQGILGAQPAPDGTLLICALHGGAVQRAETLFNARRSLPIPPKAPSIDQILKARNTVLDAVFSKAPVVQWFRLDPEEAKLVEIPTPKGVPEQVRSREDYLAFDWTFNPKGEVVYEPKRPPATEPPMAMESIKPQGVKAK